MVAGFIALLKVAVTTAGLGQTRVEASGGVTEVTVGGVNGSSGFPALVPQHPVRTTTSVNAKNAEIRAETDFNKAIADLQRATSTTFQMNNIQIESPVDDQ